LHIVSAEKFYAIAYGGHMPGVTNHSRRKDEDEGERRLSEHKLTEEEWSQYFVGHWNFPGEKQDKHLAMFPEELPRRLIRMFSFLGDTVLDPFLGSGTTSLAARNLDRNSIGYEINEDYLEIIRERLGTRQKDIFKEALVEIIKKIKEYQKSQALSSLSPEQRSAIDDIFNL
jgi:DNA modification methylase